MVLKIPGKEVGRKKWKRKGKKWENKTRKSKISGKIIIRRVKRRNRKGKQGDCNKAIRKTKKKKKTGIKRSEMDLEKDGEKQRR